MALTERIQVSIDELTARLVGLQTRYDAEAAKIRLQIQALKAVQAKVTPAIEQVLTDAGIELKRR